MTGPRVGIFGGTFDPIHVGHLRAAEEVREAIDLERIVFVPSAQPPHKTGSGDPRASAEQRLAWTRLAVEGHEQFEVDALELEREGPSYTLETVRAIAARTGPEPPVFLIGTDAFALFSTWRSPGELLAETHFAVMTRPPQTRESLHDWIPSSVAGDVEIAPDGASARHRHADTWIRLVPIDALDVSSSEIRARISKGRSVRYLLPERVHQAVVESGAYAAPAERRT
jgi:nicotinate-nucleotide adenylyltransferase